MEEDLGRKVEEVLHLGDENINNESNRDRCNVPWVNAGKDVQEDLDRAVGHVSKGLNATLQSFAVALTLCYRLLAIIHLQTQQAEF